MNSICKTSISCTRSAIGHSFVDLIMLFCAMHINEACSLPLFSLIQMRRSHALHILYLNDQSTGKKVLFVFL